MLKKMKPSREFEVTVSNDTQEHRYVVTARSRAGAKYVVFLDGDGCFGCGFGEFVNRYVTSVRVLIKEAGRTPYDYVRESYGVKVVVGDRVLAGGKPGRVAEPQGSNPRASMVLVVLDEQRNTGIFHPSEVRAA